jgi:hypothetical protein
MVVVVGLGEQWVELIEGGLLAAELRRGEETRVQ